MLMEKEEDITMKKTYKIEVDCAACALKMEDAAKKVEGEDRVIRRTIPAHGCLWFALD